ncbi:RTA1 domain protein [Rhizodiscina lignyota]|uniref:RTA1 domain protein n=1 Tax=Rhizodiscina lignyota TaxID=1504668 RepID=A0A9P4IID0_9PEZI|nr:RTA1 domain protein [Rhizodiscina lignyota]
MTSDSSYYQYTPSVAAALIFAILFGYSSLHHTYQLFRSRSWFMIPLLLGCFCETGGFAARTISANQSPDYSLGVYIVQELLILVPPILFAASIYMTFGYYILVLDAEEHSLIRESYLTKIFVIGDIIAFLTQATGASMLTSKNGNTQKTGKYIVIGGLVLQLVFFGFFMFCSILFHARLHSRPTPRSMYNRIPWRTHIYALYTVSILIMIRSVFRVVEYIQGEDGYSLSHEWCLYAFDAGLMVCVVFIFILKHPSQMRNILNGRKAVGIFRAKEVVNMRELDFDKVGITASASHQRGVSYESHTVMA